MDPFPLQWRLYNHNIRNSNLCSIKHNVYADQHRHITKKTTDSSYVYYDCRGATVGDRGSMACMPAYIAVSNLRSMISMVNTRIENRVGDKCWTLTEWDKLYVLYVCKVLMCIFTLANVLLSCC
jgi:hypothetical protein